MVHTRDPGKFCRMRYRLVKIYKSDEKNEDQRKSLKINEIERKLVKITENYRKLVKKEMKNHIRCRMPVGHDFGFILDWFLEGFGNQNRRKSEK